MDEKMLDSYTNHDNILILNKKKSGDGIWPYTVGHFQKPDNDPCVIDESRRWSCCSMQNSLQITQITVTICQRTPTALKCKMSAKIKSIKTTYVKSVPRFLTTYSWGVTRWLGVNSRCKTSCLICHTCVTLLQGVPVVSGTAAINLRSERLRESESIKLLRSL